MKMMTSKLGLTPSGLTRLLRPKMKATGTGEERMGRCG